MSRLLLMRRIPLPLGIFGELPLHCFRWAIWEHKRNVIFPQGSRGRDPGGKRDLRPSGVNNGYAIIVRPETAKAMNLKTLSDLAKVAGTLKLGAGPEFGDRRDGLRGLKEVYGLEFGEFRQFAALR